MRRLTIVACALAGLAALAPPARAQRDLFLSFTTLRLGGATRVTAMNADSSNRVWIATNGGLTALVGDTPAPGFPLNANDFIGNDGRVLDVDFGSLGDGENFFLAFPNGIEYGRVLSGLAVSPADQLVNPATPVQSLASDRALNLWTGSAAGLARWEIGGATPSLGNRQYRTDDSVREVTVAPWVDAGGVRDAAALFSAFDPTVDDDPSRLYLVRPGANQPTELATPNISDIRALAFGTDDPAATGDGNLWAAVLATGASGERIVRYAGDELRGAAPATVVPTDFGFNFQGSPQVFDLAVDPFDETLWLATAEGSWSQTPGPGGTLVNANCTGQDDTCGGWRQAAATRFDRVDSVFVDPAGNVWWGTDAGVRARIVRFLTLSSSRYVGVGARAAVTLEDLPGFADNGVAGEQASVEVSVGGNTKTFTPTEDQDSGRFSFSFGFSTEAGSDTVFQVASSTEGIPIEVVYAITDALGNPIGELSALASWANERDFEDDFWIGGVCFLDLLSRPLGATPQPAAATP